MRTMVIICLTAVLLVMGLGADSSAFAKSPFELYGHAGYAHIHMKEKGGTGPDIKSTGPGLALNVGGRWWFRDRLAVGLAVDRVQADATMNSAKQEMHSTGFLGTLSYRFGTAGPVQALFTAGVGPFSSHIKGSGGSEVKGKSAVGFSAALELQAPLTERTKLSGQLGYRSVRYSKVQWNGVDIPDRKLDVNAFSVTVGLSYAF